MKGNDGYPGAKGNPGECFRSKDVERAPCSAKGQKGEPGPQGRDGFEGTL